MAFLMEHLGVIMVAALIMMVVLSIFGRGWVRVLAVIATAGLVISLSRLAVAPEPEAAPTIVEAPSPAPAPGPAPAAPAAPGAGGAGASDAFAAGQAPTALESRQRPAETAPAPETTAFQVPETFSAASVIMSFFVALVQILMWVRDGLRWLFSSRARLG